MPSECGISGAQSLGTLMVSMKTAPMMSTTLVSHPPSML